MPIGQSLQKYTYQYLLERALSQVPDTIDKREGSIIYDALAPACYVLAEYFMEMYHLAQEVSIETASGEWLDNKVLEVGITRQQATPTIKRATITTANASGSEIPHTSVPIGSRFATISENEPLYYTIIEHIGNGVYKAECQTAGTLGDYYTGTIVPLDYVANLISATLSSIEVNGADQETDEELRKRYLDKVRYRAFGGNVAQYRELTLNLEINGQRAGIGGVQVHPTWDGGGTVKLSVISDSLLPLEQTAIDAIREAIDPDAASGTGLGLAPIGHRVTVVTPERYEATISMDIYLDGVSEEIVRPKIEEGIEKYFASLRASWGESGDMNVYTTNIYQSQIIVAALSAGGVKDVQNVTINGNNVTMIELTENGTTQQLPILKAVVLNVKS